VKEKTPAAEYVPVAHLKGWKENPRKNDHAVPAIMDSIRRFGFGAPIVARKADGMIVAGHTRLKAALELRMEEVPVRWMDISKEDAKLLALADNKLAELSDWDPDILKKVLEELSNDGVDVEGLGWTSEEMSELLQGPELLDESQLYTDKIESPVYEITGEKPDISDLFDMTKASELMKEIHEAELTEEEKFFLILASQRHIVFRYDKIAEFYAHSRAELQELMEASALVIIDFDRAIEEGFVRMSKTIAATFEEDHG